MTEVSLENADDTVPVTEVILGRLTVIEDVVPSPLSKVCVRLKALKNDVVTGRVYVRKEMLVPPVNVVVTESVKLDAAVAPVSAKWVRLPVLVPDVE